MPHAAGGVLSTCRVRQLAPGLTATDEHDDLNLGPGLHAGALPQRPFDNGPVQFHGHPVGFQSQRLNNPQKCGADSKILPCAIDCNVIFRRHEFPWIIIVFGLKPSPTMPTSPAEQWLPVLFQMALAMIIAAALVTLSFAIGRRVKNRVKDMPYECGMAPTGDARGRFGVRFYLVAMLFILFEIEAIFLFPGAVVYKDLKMFAFLEMLIFVVLILAGFFFIWKKGVLDWAEGERNVNPASLRLKGMLEEVPAKGSAR